MIDVICTRHSNPTTMNVKIEDNCVIIKCLQCGDTTRFANCVEDVA